MFLTHDDLKAQLRDKRLDEMIDSQTGLIDTAIDTAMAVTRDALYARYDVDAIFATVGTARPAQLVWWATSLAVYFLYQRIPDKLIPERIIKNYDDTMLTLTDIEKADKSTTLKLRENLTASEGGITPHKFRFGSEPRRTH